ncbi:unnamed protein product [Paramecium sonneborni]|uniref:Uncharacterized protein n=1 Tax=Paramecium sonneborni TaxID=65129 RepID=A0A8S1KGY1_9CILI|nr:unnamed protein product [Paramecium sonneborni]CAD8054790.1 unnamed protein product [Paramecium sonneborni]
MIQQILNKFFQFQNLSQYTRQNNQIEYEPKEIGVLQHSIIQVLYRHSTNKIQIQRIQIHYQITNSQKGQNSLVNLQILKIKLNSYNNKLKRKILGVEEMKYHPNNYNKI